MYVCMYLLQQGFKITETIIFYKPLLFVSSLDVIKLLYMTSSPFMFQVLQLW